MRSHQQGLPVTATAAMRLAQTERRAKVRMDEEVGGRFVAGRTSLGASHEGWDHLLFLLFRF